MRNDGVGSFPASDPTGAPDAAPTAAGPAEFEEGAGGAVEDGAYQASRTGRGGFSRRGALRMGAAGAVVSALGAVLAACGTAPSAASATSKSGSKSSASKAKPTPATKAKMVLKVSSFGSVAPPLTVPSNYESGGRLSLAGALDGTAANVGFLQGSLGLAAWASHHPGVGFSVTPALWSSKGGGKPELLTQLAGGTAPDIFPDYGDNPDPYVAENTLADLTPLVKAWPEWKTLPPFLQGASTVNGKIYAIPNNTVSGYCVVFRKDIFDQAKVPYPTPSWTVTDYVDTAARISHAKLKVNGVKVYGTNILWQYTNWYYGEWSQPLGVPTVPGYFFAVPNAAGTGYGLPPASEIAKVLGFYQELVKTGGALSGSSESFGAINNDIIAGKVAMSVRMTKFLGNFIHNTSIKSSQIGVVPMPQGPEGLRNYDLGANFYSVNATATGSRLETAWSLLRDLNGPQGTLLQYATMILARSGIPQLPPAYKGTALPSEITSVFPPAWLTTINSKEVLNIPAPPPGSAFKLPPYPPGSDSKQNPYIQKALVNTKTSPLSIAKEVKAYIEGSVLNAPVKGLSKPVWHAYYKALGAYFQKHYPKYYAGPYTTYYKQYETF